MRILNTKDPEDVAKVYPWLNPTETMTRMDIATDLCRRLKDNPDDTLLLVAIDRNITRAVFAAYVSKRRRRRKYISLSQAHAEEGFQHNDLLIQGIRDWARSKKARDIKCVDANISDELRNRMKL